MDWIDILFPVFTLILGWGLSQFGKFWADRKNDRRRLKKLLFNLLELRWLVKREVDLNKNIRILFDRFNEKLIEDFGEEAAQDTGLIQSFVAEILNDKILDSARIKNIESNIDNIVNELAEIYPIFAYELSGQYKIKERLEKIESYFNEVSTFFDEMPRELKEWLQPMVSDDLLTDLDHYIYELANKINRKTKKEVSEKLLRSLNEETNEMDEFIEAYVEKIKDVANTYSS